MQQTLNQFLIQQQLSQHTDVDLCQLILAIAESAKTIHSKLAKGALADILGAAESNNIQGEQQKKLDIIANDIMLAIQHDCPSLCAIASEELEDIVIVNQHLDVDKKYLLLFDPLDGSSNIDVNVSVGSIFSILAKPNTANASIQAQDFLQAGQQQLASGYAIYGPATMLMITLGQGVHGFTLDHEQGCFIYTHPNIRIPEQTSEFAINVSNSRFWDAPIRHYIDDCLQGDNGPRQRHFNMRWIASMVADIHRILTRGGIFMYPVDQRIREKGGRLRLMYEANPIAMLVEQAGGLSSTGKQSILQVQPQTIHQRISVILGSKEEVQTVEKYYHTYSS